METVGSGDLNGDGSLLDCSSSGIFMPLSSGNVLEGERDSEPVYKRLNAVYSYLSNGWDPLVSSEKNVEIRACPISLHNQMNSSSSGKMIEQGSSGNSRLVQHQFNQFLSDSGPILHVIDESFPEIDDLFALGGCQQFGNPGFPSDYMLEDSAKEIALTAPSAIDNCKKYEENCHTFHEGIMNTSPKGKKRKRAAEDVSELAQPERVEKELKDEHAGKQEEVKLNSQDNPIFNMNGKKTPKESTDNGNDTEDFVHIRAKRGQATNRHSLAERVRRERISERMKFLQNLVPGCNKINGKAVMLDEIINYVLSLQRQVEFLSMKLATVYPEMTLDIKQILAKDILDSRGGSAAILGVALTNSFNCIDNENSGGNLPPIPGLNIEQPTISEVAAKRLDDNQNASQMDYTPTLVLNNLESSSFMKMEP